MVQFFIALKKLWSVVSFTLNSLLFSTSNYSTRKKECRAPGIVDTKQKKTHKKTTKIEITKDRHALLTLLGPPVSIHNSILPMHICVFNSDPIHIFFSLRFIYYEISMPLVNFQIRFPNRLSHLCARHINKYYFVSYCYVWLRTGN